MDTQKEYIVDTFTKYLIRFINALSELEELYPYFKNKDTIITYIDLNPENIIKNFIKYIMPHEDQIINSNIEYFISFFEHLLNSNKHIPDKTTIRNISPNNKRVIFIYLQNICKLIKKYTEI